MVEGVNPRPPDRIRTGNLSRVIQKSSGCSAIVATGGIGSAGSYPVGGTTPWLPREGRPILHRTPELRREWRAVLCLADPGEGRAVRLCHVRCESFSFSLWSWCRPNHLPTCGTLKIVSHAWRQRWAFPWPTSATSVPRSCSAVRHLKVPCLPFRFPCCACPDVDSNHVHPYAQIRADNCPSRTRE